VRLEDPQEQKQWIQFNAFLAHLTSKVSDPHEDSSFNFANRAIWVLRETLEGEKELLQYQIETARVWLNVAGSQIQKWSDEGAEWPDEVATPGVAFSGKDWKGYNEERLKIWKSKIALD
jgi:hypothetical protein